MSFRITYSVLNADMSEVHALFDDALQKARDAMGLELPSWIDGEARWSGQTHEVRNPADTRQLLARVHFATRADIDDAVVAAQRAQKQWAALAWTERVAAMRRAADLISERRAELAAIMALEVGKNRLESLGDIEESADLMRYYAGQLEEAQGFVKPLTKLSPNEDVRSVLRPYGVFTVIAPFNFPTALAAGMSSGALLGGNAVILKPSEETPWCAEGLYQALTDAGLPRGLFQVLHGRGETVGDALVKHPGVDGVVFTGSFPVGHSIYRHMTEQRVRPCFLEMGGKNAAIVAEDADMSLAIEGCWRSAFGLSGQKCSALSRIYVHSSRKQELIDGLVAKAKGLTIGDPTRREVYMGPVINEASVARYERAAAAARADGTVHFGGTRLSGPEYDHGHFVAPTIAEVPGGHWIESTELFLPFVIVSAFDDFGDALARTNASEYGLTGGVYSASEATIAEYLDRIEAGCVYVNRAAGATTGAWPGVQAFCGWKASGSSGKGGCGPYYVAQFMREQSRTRVG